MEKIDRAEARRLDRAAAEAERAGDHAEAAALLRRAWAHDPGEPRIALNLGRALKASGDADGARAVLAAVEDHPGASASLRADALVLRGLLAFESGDSVGASALYRRAIDIHPSCADAWNDQGVIDFQAGGYAAAAEGFRKAVEIEPALTDAWFNLADALDELGDAGAAGAARLRWKALGGS